MKRANRRQHLDRMKQKAERIERSRQSIIDDVYDRQEVSGYNIKKIANHLQSCSCSMCGNPRKHYLERTRQELKNELDFKEQLNNNSKEK